MGNIELNPWQGLYLLFYLDLLTPCAMRTLAKPMLQMKKTVLTDSRGFT